MPRGDKPTTVALALKDGWIYEDALPESMTREQYDWWFKESLVLDGVRMGPPLTTQNTTDNEPDEALRLIDIQDVLKAVSEFCDMTQPFVGERFKKQLRNAIRAVPRAPLAAVEGDARTERLEAQLRGVMNSLAVSQREVERLRAGRFTPEEFQNLCHGFDESDKEAFVAGCLEYQKKLFGCAAASSPAEPEGEQERKVQCADCLTWFKPDTNHTCHQQVRRNQRSAK